MKVTALIPDDLVAEVKDLSHGKNITESLVYALREWSAVQRLKGLKEKVHRHPLSFRPNFTAQKIRTLNRHV